VDRTKEPGNIKSTRQVDEAGPLRHQQHPAVPQSFELGLRHHDRSRVAWLEYDDLVLGDLAEQQEASVPQSG
jgi:hypothetical protein